MAPEPPTWHTAETAMSMLAIKVATRGLDVAREELLRAKGLALTTATPPSVSFADAVVYQALANKQAAAANANDESGGGEGVVRLYPFDKRIMAMAIIPDAHPDDPTRDRGLTRSWIG